VATLSADVLSAKSLEWPAPPQNWLSATDARIATHRNRLFWPTP